MAITIPSHLSDDELHSGLKRLAARERDMAAELDACLAELKARGVPIPEGLKAALEDREGPDSDPGPEAVQLEFTVGKECVENLRRLQDLLRSEIPDGNIDEILSRALSALEESLTA